MRPQKNRTKPFGLVWEAKKKGRKRMQKELLRKARARKKS
jgi:hypothetical protein